MGATALTAICVGIATITDLRSRRIPNLLTFPAMAAGLGLWAALLGWKGLALSAGGMLAAPLLLVLLHLGRGPGMGDIKLAAAVGALLGVRLAPVGFCFPRFDGDPLFNALVNGDVPAQGFADVHIVDGIATAQHYQRNTAILETQFTDSHGGAARVIDFSPRFIRFGRFFWPPMLIRRIEPLSGRCRMTIRIRPSFDYGASEPRKVIGSNHLRFVAGNDTLRVTPDMPVSYLANEVEFLLDRPVNIVIGSDEPIPEALPALVGDFLDQTPPRCRTPTNTPSIWSWWPPSWPGP